MKIGYARISTADGKQSLDLQIDALKKAGVTSKNIYTDKVSGKKSQRPGLDACLKALRKGDVLVIWKLDRLGRSLKHLVNTVEDLTDQDIGLKVLEGKGAQIDTTTASGKLMFGIFGALAEFEAELISERTRAGLAAARARGRCGGRPPKMTRSKILRAQSAMQDRNTVVADLCRELEITRTTLYRYFSPTGELRDDAKKALKETK